MDTTVLLVLKQLLAKTGIGKWGSISIFFFSLMNWKLSDLVQIILRQVFQRVFTLQVVTGIAGTEVFGNLVASLICSKRSKILKNKTPFCQHQNFYVKSPRNSCPIPLKASILSSTGSEMLFYFIKLVQISANIWI